MIDPFSAATGIAGILSLTLEVSKTLYEQVNTLKNTLKEAKELLHELGLIEQVLTSLEGFLRSEKARDSFKGEEHAKLIRILHRYLGMYQISLNVDGMYVTFTCDSLSESHVFT
jgi:hypothetical protein